MALFKLSQYQHGQGLYAHFYNIQSLRPARNSQHQEGPTIMINTVGLLKTTGQLDDTKIMHHTVGSHGDQQAQATARSH